MMRTLWLLGLFTVGFLNAGETLTFHKGWQLAATPQAVESMTVFNPHAKIVWAYNAATKQWQGYSPDANVTAKLRQAGIAPLDKLRAFEAFWIQNDTEWTLTLPDTKLSAADKAAKLHLEHGWNLVSVPDDSILDTALFSGMKIWKYTKGTWETTVDAPFPPARAIAAAEGVWIYSDRQRNIDIGEAASRLHTFQTREAMEAYIREMAHERSVPCREICILEPQIVYDIENVADQKPQATPEAEDATTTNVQEAGIDESDILKHDAKAVFFYNRDARRIDIRTFAAIAAGDSVPKTSVDVPGNLQAMYLAHERLITVTAEQRYYLFDEPMVRIIAPEYEPSRFTLTFYDVSDIENIRKVSETSIDGSYVESRLKGDTLYLISSFSPSIRFDYPVVYPDTDCSEIYRAMQGKPVGPSAVCDSTGLCTYVQKTPLQQRYEEAGCARYRYDANGTAWYYDYDRPVVVNEYLTPKLYSKQGTEEYLRPQRFYAPYKLDQENTVTSIGAFNIADGRLAQRVAYVGEAWTQYASADALYLGATRYPRYYDLTHTTQRTALYKFALDDNLSYKGRGFVDGALLNQYSLSEYRGVLRAATTETAGWRDPQTHNRVVTLRENGGGDLVGLGKLEGLGEKGERIRAVRFMGEKGYVVTFLQTDPLYTLDLSDPAAPKKAGELKISGFSEYLHPVGENLLLSIGRDADETGRQKGLQLELFDISDFTHPRLADKVVVGDSRTYSEVEHNPRAFVYRDSDQRFAFPLYRYDGQDYGVGLDVYRIDGTKLERETSLRAEASERWYGLEGRGLLFDIDATTYAALFKGKAVITKTLQGERP